MKICKRQDCCSYTIETENHCDDHENLKECIEHRNIFLKAIKFLQWKIRQLFL